jgi:small subunit ribosomal protein S6
MARLQSQKDKPGTSREYETTYILRPNTTNEGVAEVNTRIKAIIEGMGGKIIKVDNWGKRRLAYEVAKERKGIYLYWQYLANPGVVEETERNLRMLDSVIRYLTVKIDEDVDVTARPIEIDESSYEKAAQTAADEEDLFLSRGAEDVSDEGDEDEFGGDDFDNEAAATPATPPTEKE